MRSSLNLTFPIIDHSHIVVSFGKLRSVKVLDCLVNYSVFLNNLLKVVKRLIKILFILQLQKTHVEI